MKVMSQLRRQHGKCLPDSASRPATCWDDTSLATCEFALLCTLKIKTPFQNPLRFTDHNMNSWEINTVENLIYTIDSIVQRLKLQEAGHAKTQIKGSKYTLVTQKRSMKSFQIERYSKYSVSPSRWPGRLSGKKVGEQASGYWCPTFPSALQIAWVHPFCSGVPPRPRKYVEINLCGFLIYFGT